MGGVVVASVIFGLGHVLMGWLAVLAATLLGLLLGLIMVLHRSIWPAVFAHGLFDATSFALLPLVTELQKASGH
jgi:membrane protease YdiL (CAAX protease family)